MRIAHKVDTNLITQTHANNPLKLPRILSADITLHHLAPL